MNPDKFSYLNLDIRALNTFVTIMETGSFTAAAKQLNITQSAVSHSLEKLRGIFQDSLFLRAGRGIKPTPRALQLFSELKPILANIEALTEKAHFQPSTTDIHWTIAANDFQRDIVLPGFYRQVAAQVRRLTLDIVPSQVPTAEQLREAKIDLAISPIAPEAADIMQQRLFNIHSSCFFDANSRKPPRTPEDFIQADYIGLTFTAGKRLFNNQDPLHLEIGKKVQIRVSNFSGLASFLRNSQLLTIAPTLMQKDLLADFTQVPLPYSAPAANMYMLWHQRHQNDAMHQWLRQQLLAACQHLDSIE